MGSPSETVKEMVKPPKNHLKTQKSVQILQKTKYVILTVRERRERRRRGQREIDGTGSFSYNSSGSLTSGTLTSGTFFFFVDLKITYLVAKMQKKMQKLQ